MATLIELIRDLNTRTGAGLMDCKKALAENDNDIEKAIVYLREKGIAKQAKKEGRIAAEGLTHAILSKDETCAVIVEFNSETDFVAKSDPFQDLVHNSAELILNKGYTTKEEVLQDPEYVEMFNNAALKLGEKLSFRRFELVKASKGNKVAIYIHMKGKISVVLESNGTFEQGKEIAMNVAAYNPIYISKEEITAEAINKETEVQLALTKEQDPNFAKKPEAIQHKIVEGRVNKILFDQVLTEEQLIRLPDISVGQYLAQNKLTVARMVRYQVGEGLEKRQDNFAEEVMAQTK